MILSSDQNIKDITIEYIYKIKTLKKLIKTLFLKRPQVNKNIFDNEEVFTQGWYRSIWLGLWMAKFILKRPCSCLDEVGRLYLY